MRVQACTITVIDDDPRVLESLVNLLSSFGYSARNYKSAERMSSAANERSRPSTYLKNSNYTVPVIIIMGKPSVWSEAFYLESDAIGFFRKPVDGGSLVQLIDSVCI